MVAPPGRVRDLWDVPGVAAAEVASSVAAD